jgi:hypothetical protein
MSQSDSLHQIFVKSPTRQRAAEWDLADCDRIPRGFTYPFFASGAPKAHATHAFSPDWASVVPSLIAKLASDVAEKKKLELRFNLFEILTNDFQIRLHKLESAQTKIVPINTFAPEPYELLKTFLVSVQSVEGGFEAGWYDANIHTTGENEEEAVSNLKSLILDFFDSLSKESQEKLGIEPKRQLAVIRTFIKRAS